MSNGFVEDSSDDFSRNCCANMLGFVRSSTCTDRLRISSCLHVVFILPLIIIEFIFYFFSSRVVKQTLFVSNKHCGYFSAFTLWTNQCVERLDIIWKEKPNRIDCSQKIFPSVFFANTFGSSSPGFAACRTHDWNLPIARSIRNSTVLLPYD